MEHNRKQKLLIIIVLIVAIVSLSVGFAAFSVSLSISSSASVSPNSDTFSVKFSTSQNSLVVGEVKPSSKTEGLKTSNGIINNSTNPIIKDLSVTFTDSGQYVEYTFYARNEGEYTAYLNSVNFVGEKTCVVKEGTTASLAQSACEAIQISINVGNNLYYDSVPITGHSLAPGEAETIHIGIEYLLNGAQADGAFSIVLPNISLVYSTVNNTSMQLSVGSEYCFSGECFYLISSNNGNAQLLSKMNITLDDVSKQSPTAGTTRFSGACSTICSNYEDSAVSKYVNNYEAYLEKIGVNLLNARLITKEEIEKLGCNYYTGVCDDSLGWITSISYWTGTAYYGSSVYAVFDSKFSHADHRSLLGVRPVIEIPLSEF